MIELRSPKCYRRLSEGYDWRFVACLIITVSSLATYRVRGQSPIVLPRQPIALDYLPSVGLVVLGLDGTVVVLNPGQDYKETFSFHLPSDQRPADMTLAEIHGSLYIIVSSNRTQASTGSGMGGLITLYTLDGNAKRTWFTRGLSSGIDYEETSRTIYFATADENAIYGVSIDGNGSSPKYLATITGITQIGPIAIDLPNQTIWCGDAADGGIYGLSLATRRTTIGLRTVGPVTGLFWDRPTQRLYAADARKNSIVVLSRQGTTLSVQSSMRLAWPPAAVSTVGGGVIAIANQQGNSVLFYNATGLLIQKLTGHQ